MKAAISVAALLLGVFLYLFAAAKLPLQRTNEAMYAVPPVRMLQTGDYLVPRYENRDFLEKPPLTWWILAASYRMFGITPFAERLPSVLASFATILLVGLWARRRGGDEAGIFAALILMFTLQFSVYARTFAADSFLALAVILAAAALDDACRREGSDLRPGVLAGAALALAFWIKGLVGVVLPAGGVAAGLLIDRRWPIRPVKRGAVAAAALLVLIAPWHVAMTQRLGSEFWRFFYWDNQFLRGATTRFMGNPRGPLFYLGALAWSAFPWSLLLLAAVRPRRDAPERRLSSLPLGLFLFGLLFFSLLVMKREVYLMPLFPAAAVLLAEALTGTPARPAGWRRVVWLVAAALPALLFFFWARGLPGLASLVGSFDAIFLGAGIMALAIALVAGAFARRPAGAVPAVALACGVLFLALALCEIRLESRDPLPAWGARVRSECAPGCDGFLVGLEAYSLDFYSGVEWLWVADPSHDVPRLAKKPKVFLVMWSAEVEAMLRDLPWRWSVLATGDVLSSQWAVDAMGLRKESPFRSLSLVEITPR